MICEKYPDSLKKRARGSGVGSKDAANQEYYNQEYYYHTYRLDDFLICFWPVVVFRLCLLFSVPPCNYI